jgi:hypothetical protein
MVVARSWVEGGGCRGKLMEKTPIQLGWVSLSIQLLGVPLLANKPKRWGRLVVVFLPILTVSPCLFSRFSFYTEYSTYSTADDRRMKRARYNFSMAVYVTTSL